MSSSSENYSSSSSSAMYSSVIHDNSSSSSSATQVGRNSDILTLILLCLPVKPLLMFKSVSRKWLSLISDSYFAKNYTLLHNNSFRIPGLFIEKLRRPSGPPDDPEFEFPFVFLDDTDSRTGGRGVPFKTLDFVNVPPRNWEGPITESSLRINHSCNGLLCCSRVTSNTSNEPFLVTVHSYIYNPTTKQYKTLPQSPFRDVVTDRLWNAACSVSLAFDPRESPDHYQVICIWRNLGKMNELHIYNLEVYSSKTNSWRLSSGCPFSALPLSFFRSGVFWNGCLHWISTGLNESSMYFDIKQDLVKPLPLPTVRNDDEGDFMYLGECRNHLYLVEVLGSCPTNYNIFEMETDYSGWNLMYKLDLGKIVTAYPEMVLHFHSGIEYHVLVLFLGETEEKSSTKLVLLINATAVISYDLKEMTYKEIYHFDSEKRCNLSRMSGTWGYVHQYLESLACV